MEKCPFCTIGNLYEAAETDDGMFYKCLNCERTVSVAHGTSVSEIDPENLAETNPGAEQQQPQPQEPQQPQGQQPQPQPPT